MKQYTAYAPQEFNQIQYTGALPEIEDNWELMNDKTSSFTASEFINAAPAGYTVAQVKSGPSGLQKHSQGQKKSKPLEVIHVQSDSQINKWGVIAPEDDPKNVAFSAYGAIADNKETLAQEPGAQSLINLNTNKWGEIDEEDTFEW